MTLIIEKDTKEGLAKLETLKWVEKELNRVLGLVFNRFYLIHMLKVHFVIPEAEGESIQIQITPSEPRTKLVFRKAIEEVKKHLKFPKGKDMGVIKSGKDS